MPEWVQKVSATPAVFVFLDLGTVPIERKQRNRNSYETNLKHDQSKMWLLSLIDFTVFLFLTMNPITNVLTDGKIHFSQFLAFSPQKFCEEELLFILPKYQDKMEEGAWKTSSRITSNRTRRPIGRFRSSG